MQRIDAEGFLRKGGIEIQEPFALVKTAAGTLGVTGKFLITFRIYDNHRFVAGHRLGNQQIEHSGIMGDYQIVGNVEMLR